MKVTAVQMQEQPRRGMRIKPKVVAKPKKCASGSWDQACAEV